MGSSPSKPKPVEKIISRTETFEESSYSNFKGSRAPRIAREQPPAHSAQQDLPDKKPEQKKKTKKKKKKKGREDSTVFRFSTRDEAVSWKCDGQLDDAISFMCDHDFYLKGFLVFGPSMYVRGNYYIRARVEDDQLKTVKGSLMSAEVDANPEDPFFQLYLRSPILIEKLVFHTLVVNVYGEPSYTGTAGTKTAFLDDMTFTFADSVRSLNGTTVQSGQIPGLIVSPV